MYRLVNSASANSASRLSRTRSLRPHRVNIATGWIAYAISSFFGGVAGAIFAASSIHLSLKFPVTTRSLMLILLRRSASLGTAAWALVL